MLPNYLLISTLGTLFFQKVSERQLNFLIQGTRKRGSLNSQPTVSIVFLTQLSFSHDESNTG